MKKLIERLVDDMGNTINMNYMSQITNRYTSLFTKSVQSNKEQGTMADAISKTVSQKTEDAAKTEEVKTISKENMSMEEYKQYISDRISSFRIYPTRSRYQYSINISDAGFEAMKNDPEYEDWVLDYIRRDMAVAAPGWYTAMGGPAAYCVLNFGATREERTGMMISAGYNNGQGKSIFDSHSDNSFWSNRADRKKQIAEQSQKRAYEKKQQEKAYAEKALKEGLQHQQLLQDFLSSRFFDNQQTVNSGVSITTASYSSAVSSYEANFLTVEG